MSWTSLASRPLLEALQGGLGRGPWAYAAPRIPFAEAYQRAWTYALALAQGFPNESIGEGRPG
jgi:hypothetical protein